MEFNTGLAVLANERQVVAAWLSTRTWSVNSTSASLTSDCSALDNDKKQILLSHSSAVHASEQTFACVSVQLTDCQSRPPLLNVAEASSVRGSHEAFNPSPIATLSVILLWLSPR